VRHVTKETPVLATAVTATSVGDVFDETDVNRQLRVAGAAPFVLKPNPVPYTVTVPPPVATTEFGTTACT